MPGTGPAGRPRRTARLGRRIAAAVLIPAVLALVAVDVFAILAARNAEREAVLQRMERSAEVVGRERRFFLDAPLDSEEVRRRLAVVAGFDWILRREDGRTASSLAEPGDLAVVLSGLPGDEAREVSVGTRRFLARSTDLDGASLVLLFSAEAIEEAGRRTALPVLLASLAALVAAGLAAAVLGRGLSAPLRDLAEDARRAAGEGGDLRPVSARSAAEVHDLAASLQSMLDDLRRAENEHVRRERLAVLGEFAAGVAHEIRNPLSSMRMTLQLLPESGPGDGNVAEDVGVILTEIDRLERSVDELLVFAGEPKLERTTCDVRELLDRSREMLRPQVEHLGLRLNVEDDDAPSLEVTGDPRRLRTCVDNLLLNALQVTQRGGVVTVRMARRGEEVTLEVEDDGPGIPEEVGEQIWEPFFSGRPGGSGLGLAVTRRLVRLHGGDVSVRSGPTGSCFTVSLPAALGESGEAG
ncbi:MAG: two-component system sensor histidine kinase NtrB [Planctomycetota bacterium]